MSDPIIMRMNKRLDLLVSSMQNLGTALFAAAAVKWYNDWGPSSEAMGWIIVSAIIMYSAVLVIGLIEAEG